MNKGTFIWRHKIKTLKKRSQIIADLLIDVNDESLMFRLMTNTDSGRHGDTDMEDGGLLMEVSGLLTEVSGL